MKTQKDAPEDRGNAVAVIFFILGLGTLLPWNFFITASPYFQSRLNTNTSGNSSTTSDPYNFDCWMTLLAQIPLLLFTLLNTLLYQCIKEKVRIAGSGTAVFLLFILTAVLVKIRMDEASFFSITMATVWFINSFGAIFQGSLFGLVGLLPPKYSSVFMSGQGVAGIFSALAMLLSIVFQTDAESSALGYFITPCMATMITILCYLSLPYLEFSRYYLGNYEVGTQNDFKCNEGVTLSHIRENGQDCATKSNNVNGKGCEADAEALKTTDALLKSKQIETQERSTVLQVFRKVWLMALCVTLVFAVTMSVFPAVTVNVKSTYPGEWNKYFITICCFIVFNAMDWMGRSITSVVQWPSKDSAWFVAMVVSRVVFIPLLMLCNIEPRIHLSTVFHHDALFVIIMSAFAFTNGYCASLCMSYAPQFVSCKDGETAGALMTCFLALGLSLGGALSFFLKSIL
ncbi:equilibrative nucleoside transporter 2 [Denticeps clupeoides]|uniref:Equilibrative nucleoside transporter 2-like n=1 Tax=Denticeps clupeoides TaxID=299321 RepID=A0AAY3ZX33_9TELE|nr:equilibrative nucleoside transporter 2 [Denticeps clupeoides]